MDRKQKQYLNAFFETLSDEQHLRYTTVTVGYFCADKENADICSQLIRQGVKTATCSMKYWYEHGGEAMPKVGSLHIVTSWEGIPTSIIEVTSVIEKNFDEVDAGFAAAEGEGDRSLRWWKDVHRNYFFRECEKEGIQYSEEMPLVLECFKVVYFAD